MLELEIGQLEDVDGIFDRLKEDEDDDDMADVSNRDERKLVLLNENLCVGEVMIEAREHGEGDHHHPHHHHRRRLSPASDEENDVDDVDVDDGVELEDEMTSMTRRLTELDNP